jgi:tetratricopeptide (TPR) repeat protein
VLRPDVNKKKIPLPNMTEVQMMFDTLMNPVPLKESTASVDLKNMDSSIDEFFRTRPRNQHTLELYLNLLAFKGEHQKAIDTLNLIKELGFEQTSKAFNYVMLACANSNHPDDAQRIFTKAVQVIGKKNINEHLYTTLAYAYAKVGRYDATWDIIQTVERDTLLKPDAVMYTGMREREKEEKKGEG